MKDHCGVNRSSQVSFDPLAETQQAWIDACAVYTPARFRRYKWRESYQLLVACLIYLRNALHESSLRMHTRFIIPRDLWSRAPFTSDERPLFNLSPSRRDLFAGMHASSALLRLPLALSRIEMTFLRRASQSPFRGLLDEDEWSRPSVYKDRLQYARERCRGCAARKGHPPRPTDEDLRVSLAILLVHRDAFAHGEYPKTVTRRPRAVAYKDLYRCRLLQAQLDLFRWGLSQLALH